MGTGGQHYRTDSQWISRFSAGNPTDGCIGAARSDIQPKRGRTRRVILPGGPIGGSRGVPPSEPFESEMGEWVG